MLGHVHMGYLKGTNLYRYLNFLFRGLCILVVFNFANTLLQLMTFMTASSQAFQVLNSAVLDTVEKKAKINTPNINLCAFGVVFFLLCCCMFVCPLVITV